MFIRTIESVMHVAVNRLERGCVPNEALRTKEEPELAELGKESPQVYIMRSKSLWDSDSTLGNSV